jgi:energy-converting hydrogenase B subunit D
VIPLQAVAIGLTGLGAILVVLTRDVVRQAILVSFYGLSLTALFVVFQAPDVALSELVVGTIAYPLVLVAALARIRSVRRKKEQP